MPDSDDHDLESVLHRLRIVLQQPLDFSDTSTDTTLAKIRLLTAAAHYFNVLAVSDFGGRMGPVRADGLVEQAVAAAFQTFAGVDPHPGPFQKAAMLMRGITQGHPFNDGNKRTGFLLAAFFLERMGYPFPDPITVDKAEALSLGVSAGSIRDIALIADTLALLWGVDLDL